MERIRVAALAADSFPDLCSRRPAGTLIQDCEHELRESDPGMVDLGMQQRVKPGIADNAIALTLKCWQPLRLENGVAVGSSRPCDTENGASKG